MKQFFHRLPTPRLSTLGVAVGMYFVSLSLTPSLLPRTWLFQGIVSGISLIGGYGLGVLLAWTWRFLQLPQLKGNRKIMAWRVLLGLDAAWLLYILTKTGDWQNRIRALVGQEPSATTSPIRILVVATLVATLILLISRLIRLSTRKITHVLAKYIPQRVAIVIGVLLSLWFFGSVVSGTFRTTALRLANNVFSVADRGIKDGSVEPLSPLRSAGPGSAVTWDDLGKQGKEFVGRGPKADDIATVHGQATEPIRVYAGLKNGDTHEQRAQVVLQELIRTEAFDRSKLVIATSTGTGYIDPTAVDTFEYLHAGDTAFATQQYSYLPSWLALLTDSQTAKDAGIALFNAVHGYWQELDTDERPELYLYGLSLGAYGSQASISRVEALNDPVDGALWVGPPFVSEFWNRVVADRDPGSPAWLPEYQDGQVIRFTGEQNALYEQGDDWQDNKIIYIQYPTDPVVFFSTDHMFYRPDWLDDPRGPDVTPDMDWYPFVTFWQLAFDFLGAGATPAGHGHIYSTQSYLDAWTALSNPDNKAINDQGALNLQIREKLEYSDDSY